MTIRLANSHDFPFLAQHDPHIAPKELQYAIERNHVYLALLNDKPIGWLRFNLFWDNIPFMNLLFLLDGYRKQGYGKALVSSWEQAMLQQGFHLMMTSTQSDEDAQHFYRKQNYRDSGSLLLEDEVLELMFTKQLH